MGNEEDAKTVTKQDKFVCGCSTSGPRCGKPD